ncbi:MAG: esterase-like activity of phytase family protein [Alphaproteobacteria bacterium]|nr:esterase-like activity of phytase family protein [Alphaproteobacteria bacterium]
MYRHYFVYWQKLIASLLLFWLMASFSVAGGITLNYIGMQIIPHNYKFDNTIVGGLSALDYNAATGRFVTISDDRSQKSPARFYGLKLAYDASGFQSWKLTDVHFMKRPDGSRFPGPAKSGKTSVDAEAINLAPGGRSYFWTSEGQANYGENPFIREMTLDGTYLRDFAVPKKFLVGKNSGIRDNLAFEGLTVDPGGKTIMVSTEGPLLQDGPVAPARHGAVIRLIQFDIKTGQPLHEYAYPVAPVHQPSVPPGRFSINGVSAILAVAKHKYIVVERSFAVGAGLSVRLYLIDLAGATDVKALSSLKTARYQPVTKKLLLDTGTLGIAIDNLEGITFGKRLKDGRRSLLMIADNNFRAAQKTQILAFAVTGLQ